MSTRAYEHLRQHIPGAADNTGMDPTPSSIRSAPAFGCGSCLALNWRDACS